MTWFSALRTVAVEATTSGRTVVSPCVVRREHVDGVLEDADGGAERAGDQVQLVLDDQVRRPQPVDRLRSVTAG